MNREDALLHFPHNVEDDLEELFEDRLFEFKQKLLMLSPARKLYDLHLKKFRKVADAFYFLSGDQPIECKISFELSSFNGVLSDSWKVFNGNKNKLKLLLSNASNLAEVELVLDFMLANMVDYSNQFERLELAEPNEVVVLSKEPDAMEITVAINAFNDQGFHNISEIVKLESDNMLYQEAIRLSLWSKKEKHVG